MSLLSLLVTQICKEKEGCLISEKWLFVECRPWPCLSGGCIKGGGKARIQGLGPGGGPLREQAQVWSWRKLECVNTYIYTCSARVECCIERENVMR